MVKIYKIFDDSNNWMATENTKEAITTKLKTLKMQYPNIKFKIVSSVQALPEKSIESKTIRADWEDFGQNVKIKNNFYNLSIS